VEDRKRGFINHIRPHEKCWNFIQDDKSDVFVKHVLRPDADPCKAYEDKRVEKLLQLVEDMAIHMKAFNNETWVYNNMRI